MTSRFTRICPTLRFAAAALAAAWTARAMPAGAALPPGVSPHGIRKALEQARHTQKPTLRPEDAAKPKLYPRSAGGSSSGSNAGNYGHDAHMSVNQRTLELTLDVNLVTLTGISDDVGLTIGLSYSSADAVSDLDTGTQRFGLPYGWKYNVSYIEAKSNYSNVVIDGSQTYVKSSSFVTAFTP